VARKHVALAEDELIGAEDQEPAESVA